MVNLFEDTFLLISGLNVGARSIIITPSLRNGKHEPPQLLYMFTHYIMFIYT